MVTAAVLWATVAAFFGLAGGSVLARNSPSDLGTLLVGVGAVITALAAVIAAVAGLRNGRKVDEAAGKADVAAGKAGVAAEHAADAAKDSAAAVRTLGPENGKTLQQLLHETHNAVERIEVVVDEVKGFREYQRTRNHDLKDALTPVTASVPLLVVLCERLLDKLNSFDELATLAARLLDKLNEGDAA